MSHVSRRGGLVYASSIVYEIVKFAEKQLRHLIQTQNLLKSKKHKQPLSNVTIIFFPKT